MDEKLALTEIAALEISLQSKVRERDELNLEILRIQETIRGLNRTFLRDALAEKGRQLTAVGLTEATRILLRKHGKPMTAADVKLGLEILGFDLQRFKNPASAVHNTLLRMASVSELTYDEGRKTYGLPFASRLGYPNPTNTQKRSRN
jgi:hypothetical protein